MFHEMQDCSISTMNVEEFKYEIYRAVVGTHLLRDLGTVSKRSGDHERLVDSIKHHQTEREQLTSTR